jgi:hypothetical protein
MFKELVPLVPPDARNILLVLVLAFFIGLASASPWSAASCITSSPARHPLA